MTTPGTSAPTTPIGVLLSILQHPVNPGAASMPEVTRLAAGEALAPVSERLTEEQRTAACTAIAQIARESTLPMHRVRAAAALLRMGWESLGAPEAGDVPAGGGRAHGRLPEVLLSDPEPDMHGSAGWSRRQS